MAVIDGGVTDTDGGLPGADGGTASADGGSTGTSTGNELTPSVPPGIDRLTTGESGTALAVDDQNIYWLSQVVAAQPGFNQVAVRSMPRGGGAPRTLAVVDGLAQARLIADADALYFRVVVCGKGATDPFPCGVSEGSGTYVAYRLPKAGSTPAVLKDSFSSLLAVDGAGLYRSRPGIDFDPGDVHLATKDGAYASALDGAMGTALVPTATDLYWLGFGSLRHRARGSATTFDLAVWNNQTFFDLALGDSFFLRGGDDLKPSGIYALPRAGGTPKLLWGTTNTLLAMVDGQGSQVFWNQDPSPLDGFSGCAGTANADGTSGRCIDLGHYRYGPVKASGKDLYYLRDGDLFHALTSAPADPDGTDGEWLERGSTVPAGGGALVNEGVLVANGLFGTLAIDADNVYFARGSADGRYETVSAVPKSGGAQTVVASVPGSIDGLDATTDFLYFDAGTDLASSWSGLRRMSKRGGPLEWLGTPNGHVIDGGFIYSGRFQTTIDRMDLAGHHRQTVARPPYFTGFTVSQGEIIWHEDATAPNGDDAGFIRAAPTDGSGSPRLIAKTDGAFNFGGLRADDRNVYWVHNGVLRSVPRAGGTPTVIGGAIDFGFDLHAHRVYWSEQNNPGCLFAADPDGGNKVCIDHSSEPHGLVRVDDTSVYFVRGSSLVRKNRQ